MKRILRILFLEDVPSDVTMVQHALRKQGLAARIARVDKKKAFLKALDKNPPDLILSDHGLPRFDGFAALAVAREKCPRTPFIFVTDSLGEEVTIKTFERGATDYVLKRRLGDLAPAIERAMSRRATRGSRLEAGSHLADEDFRGLVKNLREVAISRLDARGKILSWNEGAARLFGFAASKVVGRHFSLLYTKAAQDAGQPAADLGKVRVKGRFEEEGFRVARNGEVIDVRVAIEPVGSGFSHVCLDLAPRKRAERAREEGGRQFRAILESTLDAIILVDDQGLIREWNPAAERIFSYRRKRALGRLLDELVAPPSLRRNYRDGVVHYLMAGAAGLSGKPVPVWLRRATGEGFRAELSINPGGTEEAPWCILLVRDISEREQAQAALRQSEQRFRLLVESVTDYAIYMLDARGRVATWNAGAERLEGYKAGEIIGRHISTFFTPEDKEAGVPEMILKRAETKGRILNEGWRVRKDGSRFWSRGVVTSLRNEAGKLQGFAKVADDRTRQQHHEEEIQRLNESLEQRVAERTAQLKSANEELEAFSYSVSHDLRAPLRHISGYAEILQMEAAASLEDSSRRYLETILEATRKMNGLIDALLTFSRLGRTEMHRQTVDLRVLTEQARRELAHEAKGSHIEWKIGPLPKVRGDAVLLRQAIVNLIENALKYSRKRKPARIEIGAYAGDGEMVVFVRDNGVGFDMQYAHKLFGVFQRLHRASEFEGTGIGLANVRRVIHRHGGRTWAEGRTNGGATFYFSLPDPKRRAA